MPRGQGERCSGYMVDDQYAHCSREEHAGGLQPDPSGGTWAHRLSGPCKCGKAHGGAPPSNGNRVNHPRPRPVREIEYPTQDAAGRTVAIHLRQEFADGEKSMPWKQPSGEWGLGGRHPADFPLYRTPELVAAPADRPVIVTEGEKKCDTLQGLAEDVAVIVATVTGAGKVDRPCVPCDDSLRPLIGRPVYLWPDADPPDEPKGQAHMNAIAAALVRLGAPPPRMIEWKDAGEKEDAADWVQKGGTVDGLRTLLDAAHPWAPPPADTTPSTAPTPASAPAQDPDAAVAAALAGLAADPPAAAVEVALRALAGAAVAADPIRRAALRLAAIRRMGELGVSGPGLEWKDPAPWPDPVDGPALLADLASMFRRYAILPPWAPRLLALWTMHTWAFPAADYTPRIVLTSAEKRCGKSRVLGLLAAVVARALSSAGVTAAALFRVVEAHRPTLLIDEADTFVRDIEDLRGVLNSGFERGGAVLRCVGDDAEPRSFSTFAPVCIAGIGRLPGTIEDRAILVPMRRRLPSETVAPLRRRQLAAEAAPLRRRAARWALDHEAGLKSADPVMPTELDDRAADILAPLFAIADAAGAEWPAQTRRAAVEAMTGRGEEDGSLGTELLRDVRVIFTERGVDRLTSGDLVEALVALADRPWPEVRRGKGLTARTLSSLLKPYAIHAHNIRVGEKTPKGFEVVDFADAWARYLPATGFPGSDPPQRHTVEAQQVTPETIRHTAESVADKNGRKSLVDMACSTVADGEAESRSPAGMQGPEEAEDGVMSPAEEEGVL